MATRHLTTQHPLDTVSVTFPEGVYADVRLERTAEHRLTLRDGEIEEVQARVETGALLRVLRDGRWYTAATTELDRIDDMLAELAASRALQPLTGFEPDSLLDAHTETVHVFDDERIEAVPIEDKLALLRAHLPPLARPEVLTHSSRWIDQHRDRRFLSSKGADVRHDYQEAGIILSFTMSSEDQTLTDSFFEADHRFSVLRSDLPGRLERLGVYLDRCARFVTEAVPVEPGTYPVVLAPPVAGVFAHESFGHKSEADFMLGDPAMLETWQIGKKVASPLLSIVDTGTEWGSGYMAFDDEGQRAGKTYLIKDGILTGRLHASHTAAALGERPTGNARAISFRFEPIVRMTTTFIEPGTETLESLVAGISDGFFIETIVHGSGMSTFTIAPGLSWRIRDGELAEATRIAVLTGSVFETLDEIDGLSEAFEMPFTAGGGCGKLEQGPLSVGIGGPYVRVRRMNVA